VLIVEWFIGRKMRCKKLESFHRLYNNKEIRFLSSSSLSFGIIISEGHELRGEQEKREQEMIGKREKESFMSVFVALRKLGYDIKIQRMLL